MLFNEVAGLEGVKSFICKPSKLDWEKATTLLYKEKTSLWPTARAFNCATEILSRPCRTPQQILARDLIEQVAEILVQQKLPLKALSLSHCPDAMAVSVATRNDIVSVGVDIESINRFIEPESHKFFVHPADACTSLNLLQQWCAKEAAYKCLDQFEKKYKLTDIQLEFSPIIGSPPFYGWAECEQNRCKIALSEMRHSQALSHCLAVCVKQHM